MIKAASKFEGTHNFETFRAAACQSNQPVRHVKHCRLFEHGRYLVLDIQADGFLHHMVRNIMGCLLEIGQGMYEIDHIDAMFAAEDRKAAGITAHLMVSILFNVIIPSSLTYHNHHSGHIG